MDIYRLETGPRMSQAVVHNGTVYLAGQVGVGDTVADQTSVILASIDRLLAETGSDRSRILSATIYLTDLANFGELNAVWEAWVTPGATPARATVQATLASPEYLVEIVVVAAVA